jgi:hypothetical protein
VRAGRGADVMSLRYELRATFSTDDHLAAAAVVELLRQTAPYMVDNVEVHARDEDGGDL